MRTLVEFSLWLVFIGFVVYSVSNSKTTHYCNNPNKCTKGKWFGKIRGIEETNMSKKDIVHEQL